MIKVRNMNMDPRNGFIPVTNIWCAHTMKESRAIPSIDPIAIKGIVGDSGQQDDGSGGLSSGAEESADMSAAERGRHTIAPVDVPVRAAQPLVENRPVLVDTKVVGPVFADDEHVVPGPALPVTPEPAAGALPGDDGIWLPVRTATPVDPDEAQADAVPAQLATGASARGEEATGATLTPATSPAANAQSEAVPTPAVPNPSVVSQPPVDGRPVDPATPHLPEPVSRPADAIRSAPVEQMKPVADRGLPGEPVPTVTSPQHASAAKTDPVETAAAQESVRLVDAGVPVVEPRSVRIGNAPLQVESSNPVTTSDPAAGTEAAPTNPTHVAAPAAPAQHSALAERVLQAVELQANQPPPRTMVVDIPEIEGLRLVVSVRAGAEVHVVPSSSSAAGDSVQPFLDELQGVLENRGFVMTGDGRRRGNNPNHDEQDEPTKAPRPRFQRPTDNDLRI